MMRDMVERLAAMDVCMAGLKRQLRELACSEEYQQPVALLSSVPGIGWLTAIRLVLEWSDLSVFRSGAAFTAFLGLTPSEYSTGDRIRRGRITAQGNGQVRAWLVEAAWKAITRDPALMARFRRLAPTPGDRKRAIVAVARTLAVRLFTCWRNGQPYVIGVVK
jgi:transposase